MDEPVTQTLPDGSLRVSMEGVDAYSGQVVADAYLNKIALLLEVLGGLERSFLGVNRRRTRFLIRDLDRVNPTLMDLHPISMKKGYSVDSALDWALEQLALIEAGKAVHQDIKPSLLEKISRLPVEPDDSKIKNFKLNGRADIIEFDQQFQINALQQARDRRDQLEGSPLFEGEVLGEVRGQLREVSSIGGDRAIITPAIGPDEIECVHSERVRDKIGRFYDKNVIARGTLIYTKESPFPIRVRLLDDGLSIDKAAEEPRPTLFELRGIFALAKAG